MIELKQETGSGDTIQKPRGVSTVSTNLGETGRGGVVSRLGSVRRWVRGASASVLTAFNNSIGALKRRIRLTDWGRIVGHLESVRGNVLVGWAWDPRNPETPAIVEVAISGGEVRTVQARLFREDVRIAGFGTGHAGFWVELPFNASESKGQTIRARIAGTDWSLRGSPHRIKAPGKRRRRWSRAKPGAAEPSRVREPLHVANVSNWRLPAPPLRAIAFYLPQFHPFPENNQWWGNGFTEWTNVTRGAPQFPHHYQPHRPGELGYYDLRVPEVLVRQAELASLFGIHGFCFYFYWFSGHILMERPIQDFTSDPQISLPFCLCWANENWTRRWDGLDSDVLIAQEYSIEDDINFIDHVSRYFSNSRYIKIDNRPVLVIYRAELIPNPIETTTRWRKRCRDMGVGEIFLVCTRSFSNINAADYGFDASVEFPPNNTAPTKILPKKIGCNSDFSGVIFDYAELMNRSYDLSKTDNSVIRGAFPSWDNTARRQNASTVFINSSPENYLKYLENVARATIAHEESPDRRLVFINAWNEWAEGAHLEPDERHGYAYLEATRMALIRAGAATEAISRQRFGAPTERPRLAVIVHAFYLEPLDELLLHFLEYDSDVEFFFTTAPDRIAQLRERLSDFGHQHTVWALENRGRDVAPFLEVLARIWDRRFQFILKLHTKQSIHRPDGEAWRNDIYRTLATAEQVSDILEALDERPDVGVVGPASHLVPMAMYWGSNRGNVVNLCRRLGVDGTNIDGAVFVAGTMFFARLEALEPLLGLSLSLADFEPEAGQVDATLAHAIERIVSFSAAAASLKVLGAQVSARPSQVLTDRTTSTYQFAAPTFDDL